MIGELIFVKTSSPDVSLSILTEPFDILSGILSDEEELELFFCEDDEEDAGASAAFIIFSLITASLSASRFEEVRLKEVKSMTFPKF